MTALRTPERLTKRLIKEYVKNLLLNKTTANDKVLIGRTIPTQIENLPTVLIYSLSENIERFNQAPKNYRRSMTLAIECIEAGNTDDDLDYNLEVLGEKIEELMEVDETLGKLVNKIELQGTDYQIDPDAQSPLGALVLRYNVDFFVEAIREGSQVFSDLKRIDSTWEVGHHDESSDGVKDAESRYNF